MIPSILIVEDEPKTRRMMLIALREEFPGAMIHEAGDVATALELIKEAQAHSPYDIVVLDFKLPKDRDSGNAQVDESVCENASKNSFIIHITSYGEDSDVLAHIGKQHTGSNPTPFVLVHKAAGWAEQVATVIHEFYAGREVSRVLDALFLDPGATSTTASDGFPSATHAVLLALRTIVRYWPDLGSQHRERVRRFFAIEEVENRVKDIRILSLRSG